MNYMDCFRKIFNIFSFIELSHFSNFVIHLRLRLLISSWTFFVSLGFESLWRLLFLQKISSHKKTKTRWKKNKQTILKTSFINIKMHELLWQRNDIRNGRQIKKMSILAILNRTAVTLFFFVFYHVR